MQCSFQLSRRRHHRMACSHLHGCLCAWLLFVHVASGLLVRPHAVPGALSAVRGLEEEVICLRATRYTCGLPGMSACSQIINGSVCDRGKCLCPPGLCQSATGDCVRGHGTVLPGEFTLQNARYPSYFMALRGEYAVITADPEEAGARFKLVSLPAKDGERPYTNGHYIIVTADGSPTLTLSSKFVYYFSSHNWPLHAEDVRGAVATDSGMSIYAAQNYSGMPQNKQSVVLEIGHGMSRARLTLEGIFGWVGVRFSHSDWQGVGVEGVWVVNPSLPFNLTAYEGGRCAMDCGSYASGMGYTHVVVALVLATQLIMGFTCCLGSCCMALIYMRDRSAAAF